MFHKCLYTYHGHTDKVTYLVKNKFKTRFLSTSYDSTIRIWNLNSSSEFDGIYYENYFVIIFTLFNCYLINCFF